MLCNQADVRINQRVRTQYSSATIVFGREPKSVDAAIVIDRKIEKVAAISSMEHRSSSCAMRRSDGLCEQLPLDIALGSPHAPRVLLVAHDRGMRNATRMLLRTEGFEVLVAASVGEALARVSEQPDVHLLITDLWLGNGETGAQVTAAVRRKVACRVKAIFLTLDDPPFHQDMYRHTGLQVVTNPIDVEEFLRLARACVARECRNANLACRR